MTQKLETIVIIQYDGQKRRYFTTSFDAAQKDPKKFGN